MHTLPGQTLPDRRTDKRQSTERTSNERPARLGEEVAVKEVSTQLIREAESTGIEVFVQRLNKLSLSLVYSGPELDWVINLRVERSIAKPKLKCCR